MFTERTLWDFAEAERERERERERESEQGSERQNVRDRERERDHKDQTRRKTIKKLRSNGHWLTLLRTARTIPQPFTLNDVSVAVWRVCPDFFGMKGYSYPDNHKVHYILYGEKGLIAKGLIRRVSVGLFCVPEEVDLEAVMREHRDDFPPTDEAAEPLPPHG